METLSPKSDIFVNEDALRDHYPDQILERDSKMEEYLKSFHEVIRDKRPRNVFVYGPTGVGKTIGTKAVLKRVQASIEEHDYEDLDFEQPSVKTHHIECKDLNTSYQVAARLVNDFRRQDERDPISPTGYPEGKMYDMLFEEIRDHEETHIIIALDEIDNIGEDDDILYKLTRANNDNSAGKIDPDNVKVGIVGITNDSAFKDDLDPRVRSTLCERSVHFPPYDAEELQTILNDRADKAFHDNVCPKEVIKLTAAFAAKRSGYARTALDLLYEAARDATMNQQGEIRENNVRLAEKEIQQGEIVSEVSELSAHGKIVTKTLMQLDKQDETPAKLDKVYAWYKRNCEIIDMDPVTSRTVHNTLNDLMMNSIATSREVNKGRSGGRHYEYEIGSRRQDIHEGLIGNERVEKISEESGKQQRF